MNDLTGIANIFSQDKIAGIEWDGSVIFTLMK